MHIIVMQIPVIPSSGQRITNQWWAGCCKRNFQVLLLQLIGNEERQEISHISGTEFYYLYLVKLIFTEKRKNFKNIFLMSDLYRRSIWCSEINVVGYLLLIFILCIKTVYDILKSLIQNQDERIKGLSAQWITKSKSVTEKARKHENLKHTPTAVDLLVSGCSWILNSFWFLPYKY